MVKHIIYLQYLSYPKYFRIFLNRTLDLHELVSWQLELLLIINFFYLALFSFLLFIFFFLITFIFKAHPQNFIILIHLIHHIIHRFTYLNLSYLYVVVIF